MSTTALPFRAPGPGTAGAGPRTDPVPAVGVAAVLALVAADVLAPSAVAAAAVPIAVAGVLLGIPHGAADHLVPFWAAGRRVRALPLAAALTAYVAFVLLALTAALTLPVPTVWAFLAVSALHFGRGEVVVAAEVAGRPVPAARQEVLTTLAYGAVTVGLPLAAWRATSLPVLDRVAPGFAATPDRLLDAVLLATAGLVAAALAGLLLRARRREAAELALLALLFATVPAPAAFGVWFALWHSARHVDRLVRLPGPDGTVRVRAGLVRYARAAALPTAVAVGLLAVVAGSSSPTVLTAALVTLVGLTAPHVVVVALLDGTRRRRTPGAV